VRFARRELLDLVIAWIALGFAFALFLDPQAGRIVRGALATGRPRALVSPVIVGAFARSMLTAGIGFLLHELAHKIVAQRFGQVAGFRADYGMLFIAVVSALAGFLFAAPGAVYHQGRITERQNGLIALAGPVMNLLLAIAFAPLALLSG